MADHILQVLQHNTQERERLESMCAAMMRAKLNLAHQPRNVKIAIAGGALAAGHGQFRFKGVFDAHAVDVASLAGLSASVIEAFLLDVVTSHPAMDGIEFGNFDVAQGKIRAGEPDDTGAGTHSGLRCGQRQREQ